MLAIAVVASLGFRILQMFPSHKLPGHASSIHARAVPPHLENWLYPFLG